MSVAALTTAADTGSATGAAKRQSGLDQQDFMNLFVNQLKFQDPSKPVDNFQMASQMSQFGQLNAMNTMTATIKNLQAVQEAAANVSAAGLLGKKAEMKGEGLSLQKGVATEASYQLASPANAVIRILDKGGKVVRVIDAGSKDTAKQKVDWDGKNQNGSPLADGTYTFQVMAVDRQKQSVQAQTFQTGVVTEVSFVDGKVRLSMGAESFTLNDLTAIK
jgi:flagellar basal-body rod modification protein FlgD